MHKLRHLTGILLVTGLLCGCGGSTDTLAGGIAQPAPSPAASPVDNQAATGRTILLANTDAVVVAMIDGLGPESQAIKTAASSSRLTSEGSGSLGPC